MTACVGGQRLFGLNGVDASSDGGLATDVVLAEEVHQRVVPGSFGGVERWPVDVPVKTAMFSEARAKKRELDAVLMDPNCTLGGMLDKVLDMARRVTDELRAA